MFELVVVLCGLTSAPEAIGWVCEHKPMFNFSSEKGCHEFSTRRKWGDDFIVAYCRPKKSS